MEDILLGVDKEMKNKVVQIVDRESAIKAAVMMSSDNDIILVAGKGHEKYQEIEGKKFPFEDKTVLSKAIFEAR